ncbi:unnamed protein product [Choristocarpus tenellus]
MSTASNGQSKRPKKNSRPRTGGRESSLPHLYGPLACTSDAAILQGYLSFESLPSNKSVNIANKDASISSDLHISEARFDVAKRRFGGHAKRVVLTGPGVGVGGVCLGKTATIVDMQEVMHYGLHCRCVFVLIFEGYGKEDGGLGVGMSQGREVDEKLGEHSSGEKQHTAHLVTLSPNDIFTALSVDSFYFTLPGDGVSDSKSRDGCSDGGNGCKEVTSQAFAILDGPAVIRKTGCNFDAPWQGLELFSHNTASPWTSQRLSPPAGWAEGKRVQNESMRTGGRKGKFAQWDRLQLNLNVAAGGEREWSTSPPDPPFLDNKGGTHPPLVVCQLGEYGKEGVGSSAHFSRTGGSEYKNSALLAVQQGLGRVQQDFCWATLSANMNEGGESTLASWHGLPREWQDRMTCLCPAPGRSVAVGLTAAQGFGTISEGLGGSGDVLLDTVPPTLYVGARANSGGCGRAGEEQRSRRDQPGEGVLLAVCGGALSCDRQLPAPPLSVTVAAVDDAEGVVAVVLSDVEQTALILARDGSDLLPIEEYRGVGQLFVGDFLSNGREQVALIPSSGTNQHPAQPNSGRCGVGSRWEQTPLKTIVKRALVTDCSCIWGQGNKDDTLPETGHIRLSREVSSVGGSSGVREEGPARKRQCYRDEATKRESTMDQPVAGSGGTGQKGEKGKGKEVGAPQDLSTTMTKSRRSIDERGDARLSRLSSVADVLRHRVRTEEARLLGLQRASEEKEALLIAARTALTRQAYRGTYSTGQSSATLTGIEVGEGSKQETAQSVASSSRKKSPPFREAQKAFENDLVPCFPSGRAVHTSDQSSANLSKQSHGMMLRCKIVRLRFHAPSRTLCVDAQAENPLRHSACDHSAGSGSETGTEAERTNADAEQADTGSNSAAVNTIALTLSADGGCVSTHSAVCPRLAPGEGTTLRACAEIHPGLLPGGCTASLYLSCSWIWEGSSPIVNDANTNEPGHGKQNRSVVSTREWAGAQRDLAGSVIFARVCISPQDILGVGSFGMDSTVLQKITIPSAGAAVETVEQTEDYEPEHNIGARMDLLVQSRTASLEALPQAVRSLSEVLFLPEPWAGGARAMVRRDVTAFSSERAAEATLRAPALGAAAAVLLQVVRGLLPDGVTAGPSHASEEGLALISAVVGALRAELVALQEFAGGIRVRAGDGQVRGSSAGQDDDPTSAATQELGTGGVSADVEVNAALNAYVQAQGRTDLLVSRLIGRIVAAGGWDNSSRREA